eukprot:7723752-Lingulodinium_polyedra.AAC.1
MQILETQNNEPREKHEFAYRVNQVKYAREGRCPTNEFVREFQSFLEEELRMLEADELVAKHR